MHKVYRTKLVICENIITLICREHKLDRYNSVCRYVYKKYAFWYITSLIAHTTIEKLALDECKNKVFEKDEIIKPKNIKKQKVYMKNDIYNLIYTKYNGNNPLYVQQIT